METNKAIISETTVSESVRLLTTDLYDFLQTFRGNGNV